MHRVYDISDEHYERARFTANQLIVRVARGTNSTLTASHLRVLIVSAITGSTMAMFGGQWQTEVAVSNTGTTLTESGQRYSRSSDSQ